MTKLEMLNRILSDHEMHAYANRLQYLSKANIEYCYKVSKVSRSAAKALLLDTANKNLQEGMKPSPIYYIFNGKKHCL